jgi:DNA helicase II / ATP-dependent DNA helicase PcrA
MTIPHKDLELTDEQTAQKRYSQKLKAKARQPIQIQRTRNNFWTGTSIPARQGLTSGQLIGRIALAHPDPDLDGGSDFYIGESRADIDGIHVFSWAAPVACTFFRGIHHHEWCDLVTVIRAFAHRDGQIVDFADDILRDDAPVTPFRKRGLAIPAAPSKARRLPKLGGMPAAVPGPSTGMPPADTTTHRGYETARRAASMSVSPSGGKAESVPPVRAAALLGAQLRAPRTKSLVPVLSTLQPDQYELVTVPAKESIIIEGQPGTGKTIVASHRAAYLVNEETPPESTVDGNILLMGPTIGYTNHVRDVVNRLTGGTGRIKIFSMPQLMQQILGLRDEPRGRSSHSWQDADWHLGVLARKANDRFRANKGITPDTEDTYEYLRRNGEPGSPITDDAEWVAYLDRLPPYKNALTLRAHTPLLACIKWAVPTELSSIGHIIVDEAQDVTPLEWFFLGAINKTHTWTLLGDLNQRRSDHTLASWSRVREVLRLTETNAPTRKLQRGYRSTKPILEYANRLLPRGERAVMAFQETGPEPGVESVRSGELSTAIVDQVDRLRSAYPVGTVAVISADPTAARQSLRSAGWRTERQGSPTWERDGRSVMVVHPDAARGLEFDAVLVVEPADFPQNYGRQGPLYTALTRPNRELAVVHAKPLPDALRRR